MDLVCFDCNEKFNDLSKIFKHLKNKHKYLNGNCKLKCLINNNTCDKQFRTYDALRKHVQQCQKRVVIGSAVQNKVGFYNLVSCLCVNLILFHVFLF